MQHRCEVGGSVTAQQLLGLFAWYILNTCNTSFHFGRGCNIPSIPVETWQLQISVELTGVSSERDSLGLVPNLGKVVTH